MYRLAYAARVGWKDTRRAGKQLLVNAVIVVGICLPLLLLSGLKRGVVAQFQKDLQNSPTARQVSIAVLRQDAFLDRSRVAYLEANVPGVALVIPTISRSPQLSAGGASVPVTLEATRPGNPFLAFYGLDVLEPNELGLVLSTGAADKLGVRYQPDGDARLTVTGRPAVTLEMSREGETGPPRTVRLTVRGVYRANPADLVNGFADRDVLDRLEDFVQGRSVPDWGWPSAAGNPPVRYDGYLAFAEEPYTPADLDQLHNRGFRAEELAAGDQAVAADRTLGGVLRPHRLYVYRIRPGTATGAGDGVDAGLAADEVADITPAADVVFAWTRPQPMSVAGRPHLVVGLTGNARWLRNTFRHPELRVPADADPMRVMLPQAAPGGPPRVPLALANGRTGQLTVLPTPPPAAAALAPVRLPDDPLAAVGWVALGAVGPRQTLTPPWSPSPDPPLAVVPADLAAYLGRAAAGRLEFDPLGNRFVVPAGENKYSGAAVYATDVNRVPDVDDALREEGYGPTSSRTRVEEIRRYTQTLDRLVWVVAAAVGVFGLVTMGFVFWELTGRKSGAIAVLRVMGMPSVGVFAMLLVRAVAVGAAGCLLSSLLSAGLAAGLRHGYGVRCEFAPTDYLALLVVSVGCCLAGVLAPAWYFAVRLDPVNALLSSRLQ